MTTVISRPDPLAQDPGEPDDPGIDVRLRERIRVVACCLALTVLATSTRPGRILADTKIDMAVNPLGFLGRALHLWDAEQFGQLQNQAVGYLFPMGPFYALGDLAGLPPWITQRLWLALLLCLAFVGTYRLAARLSIGGPVTRLIAGLVYALAPNGLATLGQISSEYLPFAMLPWILLPLVTAMEGGGRIKAAARSGLAVACCGGINAAATVAVLVVPVLYLLTRPRTAPRLRTFGWWSAATACAMAWWLVPLTLTGTYGFSWLTYTEKAATTTGATGLVNVLRGAERWVNYVAVDGQIWWPVGHAMSVKYFPVLCTGVLAALGLAGLLRSRLPDRTFLLLTLLAGLVIISTGHMSAIEGPLAAPLRELLDGPLAPIRNLHKFDAVVRLPLALGVAHLLTSIPQVKLRLRTQVVALAALAGLAVTALGSGLSGPGDFPQVPKYWRDAASWLNKKAGDQGVLALPGASFGQYLWGRPMDDIMQPLLSARWGVRQLVPAGSPGYTRALNAIDRRVTTGQGSAGLAEFLGRMGIRYVLVRNDLQRDGLRGGWPARLHESLSASPGLRPVAKFGDFKVGGPADDAAGSVDQQYPPLEVFEVSDAAGIVSLADADQAIRLYGGPEGLLTLADNNALRGRPVLLNNDASGSGGTPVVSDSLRLLRRNFGELHETSPTLTEDERTQATDILDKGWDRYATLAAYSGVKSVTASASAADADAVPQQYDPGRHAYAAFDGDVRTAWETGGWSGPVGQWLKVDFQRPTDPGVVTAAFSQDAGRLGPPPKRVSVETEAGSVTQDVQAIATPQPLRVPQGQTRWLRIRVLALSEPVPVPAFVRVGITEVAIAGVHAERTYQMPAPTGAASYALGRGPGAAAECMKGSKRWVCAGTLARQDEEGNGFDRMFTAAAPGRAQVSGYATLTDARLIEHYTGLTSKVRVAASSSLQHPAASPRAAFDGDPETTWIAASGDLTPAYAISLGRRVRLSKITVDRPPAARGPLRVQVKADNGDVREGLLDAKGRLVFAPLTTSSLTVSFTASVQFGSLQVTDIKLPGVKGFPDVAGTPFGLRCGLGPALEVGGVKVPTKVSGTMGDLLEGRPVRFEVCRGVALAAGHNRLRTGTGDPFRIESALVDAGGLKKAADRAAPEVGVRTWTAGSREVEVRAERQSFLAVNENFNAGWKAKAGNTVLQPIRLDGWKQGWIVPAGTTGPVKLTYGPDKAHKLAVFAGLGMLVVLMIVAVWPRRRSQGKVVPPAGGAGWRLPTALVLAAGLGFWLAGPVGLAVTAGVAGLCAWARTGGSRLARGMASPWLVAVAMTAGAACWAAGLRLGATDNPLAPTGALGDLVPQVLGLFIVGRLAIGLWGPRAPAGPGSGEPHDRPLDQEVAQRPGGD